MLKRPKRCVFCGDTFSGQKRNFEHIIPQWLVQEADLRQRDMQVELPGVSRKVAMNRIGLKVCKTCNDEDGVLEAQARGAFAKIKDGENLHHDQIIILLDWLDKVRIGMWLWFYEQIDQKFTTIEPKFRINGRLARKDRMVIIQRYPENEKMRGLAFHGFGSTFMEMPSAFGLLANNISITSISSDFLVLRHIRDIRMTQKLTEGQNAEVSLVPDADSEPRLSLLGGALIFAQCIMPSGCFEEFDVPVMRESMHETGHSISPVMRLDGRLKELPLDGEVVKVFDGNISANIVLMERNVYQAFEFLINDLVRADKSALSDEEKCNIDKNERRANSTVNFHKMVLGARYQSLTGLALPGPRSFEQI